MTTEPQQQQKPAAEKKPIPMVTLDEVLRFIKKHGALPRAACKVGDDVVMLHGWTRHNGKLKLEFSIVEKPTFTTGKKVKRVEAKKTT